MDKLELFTGWAILNILPQDREKNNQLGGQLSILSTQILNNVFSLETLRNFAL